MKLWQGYIPTDPVQMEKTEKLIASIQGSPMFSDVAPHLKHFGAGKLSLPFKSAMKFQADIFADEPQVGPDCTTHACRNATDTSRAVEIDIRGEPESWEARGATEGLYGYRGNTGDGMNPGRATDFCIKYGLLLRKKYPFADLSTYKFSYGNNWGRSGPPAALLAEAKLHPCKYFLRIKSVEEARDALAAGYGIHCGSQYGNDGTRNARGLATWTTSWNHDMAWGAADDSGGDLEFLVLQSWGNWNRGGQPPWGPIPNGSFIISSRDAARMIAGGECWAIGDVAGWPAKDLPDYGSSSYL